MGNKKSSFPDERITSRAFIMEVKIKEVRFILWTDNDYNIYKENLEKIK
ncbi:hypothetical protein SAMN06264868_10285 [Venenivibrio stagnispumantis]|uniref:Uncharacterized protein n=1 Tax=Venenivibrio stagnispumantis TaxID=407998 RepID=A0AA46AD55_9AQUI|nr:hypothetical protein SAMN06264868_10285 [Venenivibrio stagnispumantis]